MYQRKYTGCGHPELNGLLIAETLAEYFLQRAYPQIRMTARIKSSIHGSRNQQDGSAAQIYANPRLDKNPDGSIPINSNVQRLQFEAGKMVEVRCHELADAIKEAYN